jgi:hypothetical protein
VALYLAFTIHDYELIDAALLVFSVFVVVQCFLLQRGSQGVPLPIALISFGLLWATAVPVGRLSLGLGFAFLPVYTMPDLLVVLGIVCHGLWWDWTVATNGASSLRTVFELPEAKADHLGPFGE